jgi:hypothetical protein
MLTLQQFVEKAQRPQYGCVLKSCPVIGPRGPEVWRYLKRGENRFTILPNIGDDEKITPDKLRGMIDELDLPALEFGLEFG